MRILSQEAYLRVKNTNTEKWCWEGMATDKSYIIIANPLGEAQSLKKIV